nr:reverse transcriptase domain-containing protein [Tanacetum cinerariifolium]
MVPATTSLTGFSGETAWPLGQLRLLVTIGDVTHSTKAWMNFMVVKSLSSYNGASSGKPREERTHSANFTVALHPNFPDQEVVVRGSLSDRGRTELCALLKKNLDIFAWQPSDMTGVPRSVAELRLNIREGCPPVRQKKRGQASERAKAIQAEVQKLVEARIMREVYYHDWLSNPVMVKKHDGSWRIHTEAETVRDIEKTFQTLRKINMKLNPKKCSFGLAEGVFLGYVIAPEGIKPCLEKTTAVLQLPSPKTIKEVQSLNGKLASLNRFLSKSTEKSLPLFQTLKKCIKKSDFRWTAEAKRAFQQLKQHLSDLPLLVAPKPQEELIMYLSATHGAISAVLVEVLETKSITRKEVTAVIEEDGPTWMTELVNYLKEGILPGDEKEARNLRLKAQYVMREIHEGSCSMHAGLRSVVAKAIRLGYFWPTMHKDARDMIRKCSDCQIYRPVARHPQQSLTPITTPWPFYKWGIDIAGPFPEGPGKVKFLIVAMDYFTKWIEAKAMATITGGQVKKFVWDNIVCRFGISGEIISENGKQFADNPFKDCRYQAHRTMIKSSHGDTHFSLTYGTEAVIPAEIGIPTYRTTAVDVELRLNLDLLEERRELAAMIEAKSKSKMMKYHNFRVRGVAFKPGDFVYRSNDASHAVAGGKLGPKWEGPYEVTDALGNGAYKLRSTDGTVLPRM